MKSFKFGSLAIDPAGYGSHGNAILGIRDSGKSYTATLLAEHLFDAGIPFIAFDPIGIWRYLRVPGRGKGYPIVVAGGKEGDLPLTVHGASTIVRAAMQGGVSLVIDLFDVNLSKTDWRRIVTASVRTLLHENQPHGLRHVFIEEAAEFIPQRPIDWDVYAEIEKLARMGGNSRLGYTLINQRSQEVSKAILELCENVFLHRQRGKNALENMDKWLQVAGASEQKEIIRTLPDLPQGECWAWLGGDHPTPPTHVKVPAKNSFHPDRRVMRGDAVAAKAKPVDVGEFVTGMKGQLEKIVEEAKANDHATLKAEIRRLTAELAKKPAPTVDQAALDARYQSGWADGHSAGIADANKRDAGNMREIRSRLLPLVEFVDALAHEHDNGMAVGFELRTQPPKSPGITHRQQSYAAAPAVVRAVARDTARAMERAAVPAESSTGLGKGDRLALTVLAQYHPARVDAAKAAAIARYSVRSSTWRNILSRLRQGGFIDQGPSPFAITPAGFAALGSFDPLPTGRELLEHWMARVGKGDRETLRILGTLHGECQSSDLAERAGYSSSSSTWRNILSRLRTLGLIAGSRAIKLHEDLR